MTTPDSPAAKAANPVPDAPPGASLHAPVDAGQQSNAGTPKRPREIGGPSGPEPTRYGDWERNGRVSDF